MRIMICPKCKSTDVNVFSQEWSEWGLHHLGLADPHIKITVNCQGCGYSVSTYSKKASASSEGEFFMNTDKALETAKKRFTEGNQTKGYQTISWEKAIEIMPEIRNHYQNITRGKEGQQ